MYSASALVPICVPLRWLNTVLILLLGGNFFEKYSNVFFQILLQLLSLHELEKTNAFAVVS